MCAASVLGQFFKSCDDLAILPGMPWPGTDVREAQVLQQLADAALVIRDLELVRDDTLQVDPPPAHHAVYSAVGAGLDDLGQLHQLRLRQTSWVPPATVVLQPGRALLIKPMRPVP